MLSCRMFLGWHSRLQSFSHACSPTARDWTTVCLCLQSGGIIGRSPNTTGSACTQPYLVFSTPIPLFALCIFVFLLPSLRGMTHLSVINLHMQRVDRSTASLYSLVSLMCVVCTTHPKTNPFNCSRIDNLHPCLVFERHLCLSYDDTSVKRLSDFAREKPYLYPGKDRGLQHIFLSRAMRLN